MSAAVEQVVPAAGVRHPATPVRWAAAAATAVAGGLHVAAAVQHLGAGDLVVGFFLATALAQVGAAAWLALGPATDRFLGTVVLGTVGLVVLYLGGHTTDLLDPFLGHDHAAVAGGHTGHTATTGPVALDAEPTEVPEPPVLGTVTVAVELLGTLAAAALLPARARRLVLDGLLALGALVWLLWLAGVLG
ncbi:hypothetical protein LY71_102121 [Geodermatophilus tzadiensis]|uniref:Uncharacterized protein n=1 Tax=Geodermatophilus tzadiensis TaxID=1137988 RepID=A0A2T0TZR4_9ACTN|nr:hypothetical protein [Geodermatophilus tzadiensis]PRY51058.1 hypothetical protein LY71_102121 [Geodermatophilus tzadiensis]